MILVVIIVVILVVVLVLMVMVMVMVMTNAAEFKDARESHFTPSFPGTPRIR